MQGIQLCFSGPASGGGFIVSSSVTGFYLDSAGTVYVQPMTAAVLHTVYQTYWLGPNAVYNLAGEDADGIPADPAYHQSVNGMAKLSVAVRASENVTPPVLAEHPSQIRSQLSSSAGSRRQRTGRSSRDPQALRRIHSRDPNPRPGHRL